MIREAVIPKRYALSVEVKLVEIPGQFDEPQEQVQHDPMKMAAQLMNSMVRPPAMMYQQPDGFDFRKACTVTVSSFVALSGIFGQFDELVKQIEERNP